MIFAKANNANCTEVKRVLDIYALASEQLVNFDKSAICVSPSMPVEEGNRLATIVGMKLIDCHEKYLGLPCFSGRSKRKLFSHIVDRVWNRIKGWEEKLLSAGCKKILIKAVVQSIPTYAMSLFLLPKSLILEIHRLCNRFWWGSKNNERKVHWGSLVHLCKYKSEGGLGF